MYLHLADWKLRVYFSFAWGGQNRAIQLNIVTVSGAANRIVMWPDAFMASLLTALNNYTFICDECENRNGRDGFCVAARWLPTRYFCLSTRARNARKLAIEQRAGVTLAAQILLTRQELL